MYNDSRAHAERGAGSIGVGEPTDEQTSNNLRYVPIAQISAILEFMSDPTGDI